MTTLFRGRAELGDGEEGWPWAGSFVGTDDMASLWPFQAQDNSTSVLLEHNGRRARIVGVE